MTRAGPARRCALIERSRIQLTGAEDGATRLGKRQAFSISSPVRRLDVRMENHGRIFGRIDGW
jgi:hypothetical protein